LTLGSGIFQKVMPPLAPKHIRERRLFDRFSSVYRSLPAGIVRQSERPDFLIVGPERAVGIELRGLSHPFGRGEDDPLAIVGRKRQLADLAEREYQNLNGPACYVWLSFRPGQNLRGNLRREAGKLAVLVCTEMLVQQKSSFSLSLNHGPVRRLQIAKAADPSTRQWRIVDAGWIPELSPLNVSVAIAQKELRLLEYRAKCDEIWLLLHTDGFEVATSFSVGESVSEATFATGFDRVLIFQVFEGAYLELNTSAAGAPAQHGAEAGGREL
jgi:hypothetical protein